MPGPKSVTAIDRHVSGSVRALRRMRGLSQAELARRLGVTVQQVQKYENAANRIGASRLLDIARCLGVRPSFFFRGLLSGSTD